MKLNTHQLNLTRWLLVALWLLWPLGQLQRFQLTENLAVYAHDLVCALIVLVNVRTVWGLFRQVAKEWRVWSWEGALITWVVVGWLGVVASTGWLATLAPVLYAGRLSCYALTAWLVWQTHPFTTAQLKWGVLSAVGMITWLGLLQYLWLPDTRFLIMLGWDDHYFRLIGTQLDPSFTGILLVQGFLAVQTLLIQKTWWRFGSTVVIVMALLLTYSRASYLAFGVSLVILGLIHLWQQRHFPWHLVMQLVTFVLGFFFLPQPTGEGGNLLRHATIVSRLGSNQLALFSLQPSEWLVGRGLFVKLNTSSAVYGTYLAGFPDNFFIMLLSGLGIVGFILSMIVMAKWIGRLGQKQPVLLVFVAAILAHGQFNNTVFQPFVVLFFLGLLVTTLDKLPRTKSGS
jgi:hypothetical protein